MYNNYSPYHINVRTRQELFDELNRLRKRVDNLDPSGIGGGFNADIKRIDTKLESIELSITSLEGKEVDLTPVTDSIDLIKSRLQILENSGGGGSVDLTPLQNSISELEDRMVSLDGLGGSIEEINNRLYNLEQGDGGSGVDFTGLLAGDFATINYGFIVPTRDFYKDAYSNEKYNLLINDLWTFPSGLLTEEGIEFTLSKEANKIESDLFVDGPEQILIDIDPNKATYLTLATDTPYLDGGDEVTVTITCQWFDEDMYEYGTPETVTHVISSSDSYLIPNPNFYKQIGNITLEFSSLSGYVEPLIIKWVNIVNGENPYGDYKNHKQGFGPFFKKFL